MKTQRVFDLIRCSVSARFKFAVCVFACFAPASAEPLDYFISLSQGYTHYDAKDLNRVLVLLEKTTQQQGFNNYHVDQFDGHPQNELTLGIQKGPWRLGLETEFWVEDFAQHEVPFDLRNAERENRVTCAEIRASTDLGQGLYGCVEAKESFSFLPITLQVSRSFRLGRHFRVAPGYGIGVLAGSAHIELSTKYYGNGAAPDDRIRFQVWPGVNPVHKFFWDTEWNPWKHMGIQGRLGWRYTNFPWAELRQKEGTSRVFSTVFRDAGNGSRLYIQSGVRSDDDQIFLGSPAGALALAQSTGSRMHLVEGDFSGWFAEVKANFYLRGVQ